MFPTDVTPNASESISQHTLKYSTSQTPSMEVKEARRQKKTIDALQKKISELEGKLDSQKVNIYWEMHACSVTLIQDLENDGGRGWLDSLKQNLTQLQL